jgi:hypothetical protein
MEYPFGCAVFNHFWDRGIRDRVQFFDYDAVGKLYERELLVQQFKL